MGSLLIMALKKVLIYATCQGDMIKSVLNRIKHFTDQYQIVQCVHNYTLIRNNRDYMDAFSHLHTKCDVWVYQPLTSRYNFNATNHLMGYLKDSAKTISLTYVYNYSFWPLVPAGAADMTDDFTVSNVEKIKNQEVIVDLLNNNVSKDNILRAYEQNKINWRYQDRFHECRQIQINKEIETDIKVQDFIDYNFKKHRLFWYPSHPTHHIIFYMVNQILKKLDLAPVETPPHQDIYDTSPNLKLPYTTCASQTFDFEFEPDDNAYDFYLPYLQRLLK